MPARLHLVDGTFELFRAHYSKRPDHRAPDGQPAKASIGVVTSLLALLQDAKEQATHVAVAFDNPIESFRNDLFAGYKTGEGMDPDLASQFDLVEEGVRAAGMVVWSMKRWEADDALATAAARWKGAFDQVRILTPDKDLGQALEGDRVIQVDRIRSREINEAALRERRGIAPQSVPDWLALTGDTADGIPGLPGFGERTASALLARYLHIEHVPDGHAQWDVNLRGVERLAAVLRERRDDALLYRRLATLVTDVPLPETSPDELRWAGLKHDAFAAWCARVGSTRTTEFGRQVEESVQSSRTA